MKRHGIVTALLLVALFLAGCSKGGSAERIYEKMNVFDNVAVEITGIAPCAKAEVKLLEEVSWYDAGDFSLDKSDEIKNGDVITVFCNIPDERFRENGYERILREKSYLVPEFDMYVNDMQQLAGTRLTDIIQEEMEQLRADTENSQDRMLYRITGNTNYLFQYNKEWIEQAEVYEVILCTPTDYRQTDQEKNILYVILKVVAANSDYKEEGYFAFEYRNVVLTGEGSLYVRTDAGKQEYFTMADYEELYKMLVEPKSGDYYVGSLGGDNFESIK